mmetsp:Transcript_21175/g.29943  ORF Transcript_21175/g.29943 Transcript_21175/m.29943 type:complete len:123 (-) Transcript_21175:277-645(-)
MTKPLFLGGSLSFKGDKKKKRAKKKNRKSKHQRRDEQSEAITQRLNGHAPEEDPVVGIDPDEDDDMTDAERRALKYRLEKEKKDLEKVAAKSHRERVEEFNQKLGELTEHNDIPRVSAAGNG